ncbi:hypothetical protein PCASD_24541 [Puccinia coronata f. sp. avenae]|uniref:SWR1-complex protein 4 n=1 Tax=Puccinia coronata f. sp. avenae TaxID=200324 RepID=A0A2N5RWE8_9BASI|nr:hypothetical protein PCASD_24541 [Puccinia coronata f. sp. avenae]
MAEQKTHHTETSTEKNSERTEEKGTTSEQKEDPSRTDSEKGASRLEQTKTTLAELIGNNVPSIPLQVLKTNPRSSKSSSAAARWTYAPINNPARRDGLQLKHWKRSDDQEVYRFAKYNTTSNQFSYTTEEYYHLLRDDDWTKAETDYLFDLLNTYDLRFPVVHDRYEYVGSHERTLDDLKARYYSICQKLIPHRPNLSSSSLSSSSSSIATTTTTTTTAAAAHLDDPHKKQFIQSYHFDKQREMERKKHVKSLMNRTPAQLQEEEFIYIETRRLEQNLLKRIKNRDELMKLIGGFHHHMLNEMKFWPIVEPSPTTLQLSRLAISNSMNSNLNSAGHSSGLPPDTANRSNSHLHPLEKRNNARRDETMMDEAAISASAGAGGDEQEVAKARDPQGQMESDKKHCIYRLHSYHAGGSTSGSSATHYRTVGLRSTRITLPKTVAASTRLSTVMSELEIPSLLNYLPKPLVMPSRENVESYERLIQATNELADLRRHADRVDSDLKAHRKKKDTLLAALATPPAPLPYSSTEEPSLLPGPANTASVMNDPPLAPELNSQAESNQQDPTQPGLDLPKSTSNKKRAASECSSSSSSESTIASSTHHNQHSVPKPGSQTSRKKIRKK